MSEPITQERLNEIKALSGEYCIGASCIFTELTDEIERLQTHLRTARLTNTWTDIDEDLKRYYRDDSE